MAKITENRQGLKMLLAGSVLQLFLGIIYVWSVFVEPVSRFYSWDIGSVKLTASFMLCFFVVGILAGGKLQATVKPDKIALSGGLMLAAGIFAASVIPASHPWLIYVTYGIVGGFGVGMAYNAIISAAQKWFPQNRGFATGISVFAFGFSTVVFAPLVEALVAGFGLKNTFVILAAVFLAAVLALFRFITVPADTASSGAASAALAAKKQYTTSEAIKTKEFYLITGSMMLGIATFFILNPSLKTLAVERGLDPAIGTVVVMTTGVANAFGRLGVPLLSDKIGREKAAFAITSATALCAALLCFVRGVPLMLAIAVIAFCYGGFSGIYPVITADYFGIKNVGSNYGAVMMGFAAAALVFPVIIGFIGDATLRFAALAALSGLGALLVVLLAKSKEGKVS